MDGGEHWQGLSKSPNGLFNHLKPQKSRAYLQGLLEIRGLLERGA